MAGVLRNHKLAFPSDASLSASSRRAAAGLAARRDASFPRPRGAASAPGRGGRRARRGGGGGGGAGLAAGLRARGAVGRGAAPAAPAAAPSSKCGSHAESN